MKHMLLWAAVAGLLIAPLRAWLHFNIPGFDLEALTMALTLVSGFGATALVFSRQHGGLWAFIKYSLVAFLVYYTGLFLATYILFELNPVEEIALLPLILIVGYFAYYLLGLLLGWLAPALFNQVLKKR